RSRSILYVRPEQPPPTTLTRRPPSGRPLSATRAWILRAAPSVIETIAAGPQLAAFVSPLGASRRRFQSAIAALIPSSASTEQWILTGGSESSCTIWVFLIFITSSIVLPLTSSVT